MTIEVLRGTTNADPASTTASVLPPSSVNHWHRHKHDGVVKELYVTPGPSETSFADDPRAEAAG